MTIIADVSFVSPIELIYRSYTVSFGNHTNEQTNDKTAIEKKYFIEDKIKKGHTSPLKHSLIQVDCTVPIFVARQLAKHQVGMSINEISRRYTDKRIHCSDCYNINNSAQNAIEQYYELVKGGMAKEDARSILPVSIDTEFVWSGSALGFANMCLQRLSPHAQSDTRKFVSEFLLSLRTYSKDGAKMESIIKTYIDSKR